MKNRNKKAILIIAIIILTIFISLLRTKDEKTYIKEVFNTPEYSYLPKAAMNYIEEVYNETGEVLLTEKNKEENRPYLNPDYISYLDMTDEEKSKVAVIPSPTNIDYVYKETDGDATLSEYFTLTNYNGKSFVTPVRSQGSLDICWSFASIGAVESNYLLKNNVSYSTNPISLSERQLDYATANNSITGYDNKYLSFVNRPMGYGGNFYVSTIAMASGISLYNRSSFTTDMSDKKTTYEFSKVLNYNNSVFELNETIDMPRLNVRKYTGHPTTSDIETINGYVKEVKNNILKYGAAYVSTYANDTCSYYDSRGTLFIDKYNCSNDASHAMLIIGWDDNYSYSYCADTTKHEVNVDTCSNRVTGKGAWILKNSWGSNQPYPYLAYDSEKTDINFVTNVTNTSARKWHNNYIFSTASVGSELAYPSRSYSFDKTEINGEEEITQIKFIVYTDNSSFNIEIKDSSGTIQRLNASKNKAGLLTVPVSNIKVNSSSTITIRATDTRYSFIDRVLVFTVNTSTSPYVSFSNHKNLVTSSKDFRFYSDTRNINPNSTITYKLYNSSNVDISSKMTYSNSTVGANGVNPFISLSDDFEAGKYHIDAIYNNKVVGSTYFTFNTMAGRGTKEEPFIITNDSQLDLVRQVPSAYYELGNDIDLTSSTRIGGRFYNGGYGWVPIENFKGSFDGKGHTIKGLKMTTRLPSSAERSNTNGGLFGQITDSVTIKNLVLENFDISCHGNCGILAAKYMPSSTLSAYSININNIVIKDNVISNLGTSAYLGSLMSSLNATTTSSVNINNIYTELNNNQYGLLKFITGESIILKNIQINTDANNGYTGLANYLIGKSVLVENIFSTFNSKSASSLLMFSINSASIESYQFKNVNSLKIDNKEFVSNVSESNKNKLFYTNAKMLDFNALKNSSNYSTWGDFNVYWKIETIDGIPRFPVLKNSKFEYTKVNDISINLQSASSESIYDYIYPNTEAARRITYSVADETIATIDASGHIIPKRRGKTTVHIKSFYDGYEKDVPLTITSNSPYFNLRFNSNGGTGTMASDEIDYNTNFQLPANKFTKENHTFKEWNTLSDGKGISYADKATINVNLTFDNIYTLYAIWKPNSYTVKFDKNGGSGNISSINLNYNETKKLPKNTITRDGYIFRGWNTANDGSGTTYTDEAEISGLTNRDGEVITLYALWQRDFGIVSNQYQIEETPMYINQIPVNTTEETFKNNFQINSDFTISVDLKGKTSIATGSKTKVYKDEELLYEFTNVVKGDVNGDGKITYLDYVSLYNHISKEKNPSSSKVLLKDEYLNAGDMSNDNKITYLDYVKIYQKIKELKGDKK